jgi:hypothetical protein
MNAHMLYFLIAVGAFLVLAAGAATYYYRKATRTSRNGWEELLARLTAVDREGIRQIARDLIDESGQRRTDEQAMELEPDRIWDLIGGLRGLEALEKNSHILIEMATYIHQWYPEALAVAEELRLNCREIEWHVSRLKMAAQGGTLEGWFANYAQNATASYYLMTQRVIALYERGSVQLLPDIQRAL